MKNKTEQFKNGFTLAEVLITLVIVGVVAAMTIPTAINNSKEQELKSQFKKAYSTITQAFNKTEMNDFYGYAGCYYGDDAESSVSTDCRDFFDKLAKNLNIQKVCQGNAKADGCVPVYQSYPVSSGCSGFRESNINNINKVFVLSDGTIIIPFDTTAGAMPLFLVDINGHKGPNAGGKDIFSFSFRKTPDDVPKLREAGCFDIVEGGRTTNNMIKYALAGVK